MMSSSAAGSMPLPASRSSSAWIGVGRLQRREDALGAGQQPHTLERLVVGGAEHLQPSGLEQRGELRADAGVVEAGRDGEGLGDLAVVVLEQVRARAVEDAG